MAADNMMLRAMGSEAQIILVDPHPGALDYASSRLRQLDQLWSRFIVDSELNRLNARHGSWSEVSSDTVTLIMAMKRANEVTDGSYDPTFLYEVLNTGYTESIVDPSKVSFVVDLPCPGHSVHDVIVDHPNSAAFLPFGMALDAGGIGKGLAAGMVVAELRSAGTGGALVSVGGDIVAGGRAPEGRWAIDVARPDDRALALTRLMITEGGVATSSTISRQSVNRGERHHHTIDPATRLSAQTDLAAVTVVAANGWLAEAHATAVLVAGSEGAAAYLESRGLTGIAIHNDGSAIRTGELADLPVVR